MPADIRDFRLSPRAQHDLEEIWLYTRQTWSLEQADSYVSDMLAACGGLAAGEKIGVRADDIRTGYWKHFCGAHMIYYRVHGPYLDIIRILHHSRDVKAHLTE
jgi:toxin ParE1/3/4